MARFYLNLSNSAFTARDDEGVEAADVGEARKSAIAGIRGYLGHELASGVLDLRGRIDIVDDDGDIVMTVPFSDAVTVVTA